MVEMSTAVELPRNIQISNPHTIFKESEKGTELVTGNGVDAALREAEGNVGESGTQYSREEMLLLEKTDLAILRPGYLDNVFDRDGRWDPMAWHSGQPLGEADTVPAGMGTLEFRKRTRSNAADSKDVEVILSPQRMSFGNGCAGSKVPPNAETGTQINKRVNGILPKYNKFEKNPERTRDPDREKHLQKINGNHTGNREQIRKAIRDLHDNRERASSNRPDEDEPWLRNSEYSSEFKPEFKTYKDTKYNSSNGGMMERQHHHNRRNWNPRRNSERSLDDEPEWFTEGPTSRLDTIELKGFEDDDKIHSNESETTKDESKGRETELAMDPLGNPEMTSASNQYANESMYSTGLQEDWDPTHPKFNVDALFDPEAFQEEGKDLLEAEKSINVPNSRGGPLNLDFWAGGSAKTSSPNDYTGAPGQQRPDGSPGVPGGARPDANFADVHFGENMATSNLKAMLGVDETGENAVPASHPPGMHPHGLPPPASAPIMDPRGGNIRPNLDDPIIRQLLANDHNLRGPHDMMMRHDMMAQQGGPPQQGGLPRGLREMLFQRSQSEHLPPPGPMLPHPGPVMTPRHPVPEMHRDPRLHDPRVMDPRLMDPRFSMPSPITPQGNKPHPPKNGQDLLRAVKNDPAQLDKVISCLQNTLKLGNAPQENQPAMHALLRDMEKAKGEQLLEKAKLHKLQQLTSLQHQLSKHPDQILHDKTQALKALLRLNAGHGGPLMTAPARMAPLQHHKPDHAYMRPRMNGDDTIPTRITNHHDQRVMMGNKPGFPMAFTPTSVMLKSQEARNFAAGRMEQMDAEHNINLTPSHMQPSPQTANPRLQYRPHEVPGVPNGRRSPRYDDGPKPVPTIETSRGMPKLHFPPGGAFAPPPHPGMKGMPPPSFAQMHQAMAKNMPASPHTPGHLPSQLIMQELMHSHKAGPSFNQPPVSMQNVNPAAY